MEKCYGNRSTSDVIVYLIPSSTTEESGDAGRKRKRNAESMEGLLATLNLHSKRLRHCSRYFQILLDKRWSNSDRKSPMEFFLLEVQTDVKYYEDCFSRMYVPNFTGIPSVDHALELLKVASQIEFAELVSASVGYLSLVKWSLAEEQKILKFPFPLYISSSGLSELNERLCMHGTTEESYQRLYEEGLDSLRSGLESALPSAGSEEDQSSVDIFAAAFDEVVSGSCYDLAQDACALVTERAQAVLLKVAEEVENPIALESDFRKICWLFELLLNAKGAKELVEHIVRDRVFCDCLPEKYRMFGRDGKWPLKWMTTLLSIFEEVLAGRLLLKSSDRVSLFSDWEWLLFEEDDLPESAPLTLSSFMMTLPREHQTTKLKEWMSQEEGYLTFVPWNVLEVAQPLWIKNLQRSLVALHWILLVRKLCPKMSRVLLHLPPANELNGSFSCGLRK